MNLLLRERFARLGPIRDVDRVQSGSPATFVLRLAKERKAPRTIDAMLALVRRGLTMLRAKRAIEAVVEEGRAFVTLPVVEDAKAVTDDLARTGIMATPVEPSGSMDVRRLRERLGLTREEFAVRFGLEIETVRNWETGKRQPDTTARSYLRVIANDPEHVEEAYALTPSI